MSSRIKTPGRPFRGLLACQKKGEAIAYSYREVPEPTTVKETVEYVSAGKVHPNDTHLIRWAYAFGHRPNTEKSGNAGTSYVALPGPEKPSKRRRKRRRKENTV